MQLVEFADLLLRPEKLRGKRRVLRAALRHRSDPAGLSLCAEGRTFGRAGSAPSSPQTAGARAWHCLWSDDHHVDAAVTSLPRRRVLVRERVWALSGSQRTSLDAFVLALRGARACREVRCWIAIAPILERSGRKGLEWLSQSTIAKERAWRSQRNARILSDRRCHATRRSLCKVAGADRLP